MENDKYLISAGQSSNFQEITALWKESVKATHDFLAAEDFIDLERDMQRKFLPAVQEIWLCRSKNRLAGFCGNNGSHIEMLFVHPEFMRKGVGTKLLKHVSNLYGLLSVDVNEQNMGASKFYRQLGFKVTRRTPLDGQGRDYPLLHMAQQP